MNDIRIGNILIGETHRPFIIAEMSGNHNHSLQRARAIVKAAYDAGAHAIKLQTYTADTMTVPGAHVIADPSPWQGRELYELYKEAYTPWEWHKEIFDYAQELGMIAFSTPFDETAVDFLEQLNVPAYKIASFENTDWPLMKKVAQTGKPVILSTGASTYKDLEEAVAVLRSNGCKDLILLKCTSTYPATPENTNLLTIPDMRQAFNCLIGLSDHTMGTGVAVASIALGSCVIEKHFTLRRSDGGVDSTFSMEPEEMHALVVESERAFLALGSIQYEVQEAERSGLIYKRSVYVVKNLKPGETLTKENTRVIRPGFGILPKFYEAVLGRTVTKEIKAGTPLSWEMI